MRERKHLLFTSDLDWRDKIPLGFAKRHLKINAGITQTETNK